MEIQVKDFRHALEVVKPGVSSKEMQIDQVTAFAFTGSNVITYNDEITILHPLKDMKLTGAVKAEELYQFLSKVKTETIKVESDDDRITLKSGRAKCEFAMDSEILLPLDDSKLIEKGKWRKLPDNFAEALTMARTCASSNMADPKLTCVHVNKNGVIEGSDRFRILQYNLNTKIRIDTVLIPAASIPSIVRIKPTEVASGNEWIHFKNEENTILSCRVLNEDFVNVEPFLELQGKVAKIEFPKELADVLNTAEIFAKTEKGIDGVVTIEVQRKKLIISSQSDVGKYSNELKINSKVTDFAFTVSPYLMRDILKQTTTCIMLKDRLYFEGENWKYVTGIEVLED